MSEFLAEAAVLIRPDTTKFRAELVAQLRSVTRGITVPVPVVAQAARATAGSTRQTTAAIQQQTAATKQNLTVKQQQAIADRQAAAEAARLSTATGLVAKAQAQVTAVERAGVGTTTALAKARAEVRAATAAVAASQRALTAAQVKGAQAAEAEAKAVFDAAAAKLKDAQASEVAAVSNRELAASTQVAERKLEQFRRGAEASALSLLRVRAATLAASSPFLIAAAGVEILHKAVEAARSEEEAAARAQRVFGHESEELEKRATGLAKSFGIASAAALGFEANFGVVLTNAKVANEEVPVLSESLVKLAADLAAFRPDIGLDKTLRFLNLALVGNARGLRQFGVEMNQARVNQVALTQSGKENTDQLTRQDRVLARVKILFDDTAAAQGAAERRSGDLAQGTKILEARLENLGATVGKFVTGPLAALVGNIGDAVGVVQKLSDGLTELAGAVDKSTQGRDKGILSDLKDLATTSLPEQVERAKKSFSDLKDQITGVGDSLDKFNRQDNTLFELHVNALEKFRAKTLGELADNLNRAVADAKRLAAAAAQVSFAKANRELDRLDEKLVDIQIGGGGPSAELGVLARQEAAARRAVAAAEARAGLTVGIAGHDTAVKQRREAKQRLLEILQQERENRKELADAAVKAAEDLQRAVEHAQELAQDAIDKANDDLQNLIDAIARPLDFQQARAEATASLVDDVRFQQDLQKAVRAQIAVVNQMILTEAERAAKLHDLRLQLVNSQIEEKRLRNEQKKNAQERRANAFDRAAESIDLDIELAQTNKNIRAEIAARQKRIELDIQRQKQVKGDILATKRLRNDIAEQRKAIKELKKELDKRNNDLQQLQFAFLQRQTGFVTNLLSNLLPTGSVAGTVGGSGAGAPGVAARSIAPRAPGGGGGAVTPTGGGGGGVIGSVGDFTTTATERTPPQGVTTGQMSTLIHVQRQMLAVLIRLVGTRTHPEAAITKAAQSVNMDFF